MGIPFFPAVAVVVVVGILLGPFGGASLWLLSRASERALCYFLTWCLPFFVFFLLSLLRPGLQKGVFSCVVSPRYTCTILWSMTKGEWLMKRVHLCWAREREKERAGDDADHLAVRATGWLRVSILLPCPDGTFLGGVAGMVSFVCVCVSVLGKKWERYINSAAGRMNFCFSVGIWEKNEFQCNSV